MAEEIECIIAYKRDPTQVKGAYQEIILRVGAQANKLDELRALLEPEFDSPPKFSSSSFNKHGERDKHGENTQYLLKGKIGGVRYLIDLKHIGCPVPPTSAEIHHALVRLPAKKEDRIAPIIETQFQKYQAEIDELYARPRFRSMGSQPSIRDNGDWD